jgi:hypothetical protein
MKSFFLSNVLLPILLLNCSVNFSQKRDWLKVRINSVYVHQYEKSDSIIGLPVFTYNCTVINRSDSVFSANMRHFPYEKKTNANCLLIHGNDTLSLFLSQRTVNGITVPPNKEVHFDLTCEAIPMIDFLEARGLLKQRHGNEKRVNEVDVLVKFAKDSKVLIHWPPFQKEFNRLGSIKTLYRDPNDKSIN